MNTREICRPQRLTCRWVFEITRAISVICADAPTVSYCKDAEHEWRLYLLQLDHHPCGRNPEVGRVLQYERDYRDYLEPEDQHSSR